MLIRPRIEDHRREGEDHAELPEFDNDVAVVVEPRGNREFAAHQEVGVFTGHRRQVRLGQGLHHALALQVVDEDGKGVEQAGEELKLERAEGVGEHGGVDAAGDRRRARCITGERRLYARVQEQICFLEFRFTGVQVEVGVEPQFLDHGALHLGNAHPEEHLLHALDLQHVDDLVILLDEAPGDLAYVLRRGRRLHGAGDDDLLVRGGDGDRFVGKDVGQDFAKQG